MCQQAYRITDWDEAAELWKKETSSSDPKLAGMASFNMAIVSEIKGELDIAIEWAKKSYENYGNKKALKYLNILKNRKAGDNALEKQLEK